MMAIFLEFLEELVEIFMDEFLGFENLFDACLANLDKVLKQCEDNNLVLKLWKNFFLPLMWKNFVSKKERRSKLWKNFLLPLI